MLNRGRMRVDIQGIEEQHRRLRAGTIGNSATAPPQRVVQWSLPLLIRRSMDTVRQSIAYRLPGCVSRRWREGAQVCHPGDLLLLKPQGLSTELVIEHVSVEWGRDDVRESRWMMRSTPYVVARTHAKGGSSKKTPVGMLFARLGADAASARAEDSFPPRCCAQG